MNTLTITLGILAPVITFLIGRYFRAAKIKNLQSLNEALTLQNIALLTQIIDLATVKIVPNINPHHAADKEYIGIYPNNGLEPAHLTVEEYQKGVDRLKDHPEDNILTNKN